ncbi:uncharacterized protein LOC124115737 isoform X1 [Haliotis rufescens]|uniref:uncharacterized protein LOC124115737 isoform X1 n=1 Tax=Haliotis rufescens TaxID=6454 RepID=UPI00201EF4D3|nr:uncharacterized protein LOC124115737 isoform X1 [Haliotis rufescens]
MAMYDKEPLLDIESGQCPGCHQDFTLGTDGTPTYLSCGHSVCFKCIQIEWCKSVSEDADVITCPICTDQILICFDKEAPMKIEEQPLESARNNMTDVLRKAQMDNQISASLSDSHTNPGCRDVLISQTTNKCSSHLNPTLSDSDMVHMDSEISLPILDGPENKCPKAWTLDVMNLQALLEKETGISGLTQHISQDSMFSDHGDSDIGTVQDLLKLVNIPGESLFEDNSLSNLETHPLMDETSNSSSLKNSLSSFELSELSQFLQPHPGSYSWQMPSSNLMKRHPEDVDIHIGEENDDHVTSDLQPFSVDQRGIFETLEGGHHFDGFVHTPQAQGRRQGHHNKARKKSVLSRAVDIDSLNLETMTAVNSIEVDKAAGKSETEKIPSMKESLYKRFYPKSSKKPFRRGPVLRTHDRSYSTIRQEHYQQSREEIDIPDMQMVKIVSDVQIPEEEEPAPPEMEETSRHNYGYVKNSMLPNGNEIKNLYVVPKTWLNNDEVEVQFTPTESDSAEPYQAECSMQPEHDMQNLSAAVAYPMTCIMPSQHSLLQPFSRQQITIPKVSRTKRDTSKSKSTVGHTVPVSKPVRICPKESEDEADVKSLQFTSLPGTDDLISGESPFETEMVHVRYEINDGQIVFIPEPAEGSSSNDTVATERYCDKEQGPLLILTVQDSESSDGEKCKTEDRNDSAKSSEIQGSLGEEKPDKHIITKSIIQPNCFESTTLQEESVKIKDNIQDLQDLCIQTTPTTKIAESVHSSVSIVPSASSSSESCQRAFSSPESITPEDILGWHMSHNNSRNSSRCELSSRNENHIISQGCSDTNLHDSVSPCHGKMVDHSQDLIFNEDITFDSGEQRPPSIGDDECSLKLYKDTNVSVYNQTVGNNLDLSSTASCSLQTCTDGVDYGSPPELERMVKLPLPKETDREDDKETKSILGCVSSTKVSSSEIFNEVQLSRQNEMTPPRVKAEKRQLEIILEKLAGLSNGKDVTSDMNDLSYQIGKLNEINQKFFVHTELSFYNHQSKKIYDMIIYQVSSLIACEKSVQCFEDNADILGKETEKEMCTQRYLFKQVVKQGIGFITELVSEYERVLDKSSTDGNELEVSSSGLKDLAACEDEDSNTDGDGNGNADRDGNLDGPHNGTTDRHLNGDAVCVPETDERVAVTTNSHWQDDISYPDRFELKPKKHLLLTTELFDERSPEPQNNELNSLQTNEESVPLLSVISDRIPQERQGLPLEESTSEMSLTNHVSDIALNVEIGNASSNESVLPSLSDVMRTHNHQDKKDTPEETGQEIVTLQDDSKNLYPQYFGEDKDNSDSSEDENEDDDEAEENLAVSSPVQKQQNKGRKRKMQSLDENDLDSKRSKPRSNWKAESGSTPKRQRQKSGSQAPHTSSKSPASNAVKGKKKKVKKKDIYASSSEEVIPPPIKRGFQYTDACFKVFNTVYNHEGSDPFCKEIKSKDVPDYYKVVKRAMWLDLIAHKLRSSRYERLEDYVADMRLVFMNSHRFNKENTEVYESGITCEKLFEKKLAEQFPDKQL